MGVLDLFRLDGRVALITGAGRGIGLAIAQALAEVGAAVAVQDIDADVARCEAKKIADAGGKAIGVRGDITKLDEIERLPAQVRDALGGEIDILVNNASIQSDIPFLDYPPEQMETVLRANLVVPMRLAQLVLPGMQRRKWGRVLNLSSIQAKRGATTMTPYAASKAAIEHFTRNLARAAKEPGVTVNCISPGWYDTYRNKENLDKHGRKADWLPAGRLGQPADCAGAALLLCSDASAYITGVTLEVDGGMHVA